MARIAGVDLPNKKRMEYALTYIFGIGLHHSRLILTATGVDFNKRAFELTEDEAKEIFNFVYPPENEKFKHYWFLAKVLISSN